MTKIELIKGDITQLDIDAIVNAANSSLMGGGGVDGAIHQAGGPAILEECKVIVAKQGGCPAGEAVITSAGKMPAKYVIHTVGPIWRSGLQDERSLLAKAYQNSLKLALAHKIKSIAFPNISTGVYSFPKDLACEIAIREVTNFLEKENSLSKVIFVCFDEENYELYDRILNS